LKKLYNIINILFIASLFALGPTTLFAVPNYLFLILLVVGTIFLISDRKFLKILKNRELGIQFRLTIVLFITSLLSRYSSEALPGFFSYCIACLMGVFSAFLIKDEKDLKNILMAVTLGGLGLVIFYMQNASLSALQTRQLTEGVLSLNSFSHTIIISFCAGFMLLTLKNSKFLKFSIIAVLFIFFIALILSGSRQSLVTILTLFVVYVVIKSLLLKKGGFKNIFIGIIGLIIFGYLLMEYGSETALLKRMSETNVEEDERFELIALAFKLFLDSPILGHGIGTFKFYNNFYVYTHNTFLELLFVGGFFGLFFYLMSHYSIIKFIYYKKFDNVSFSAASISVLMSFLVSGQFFILVYYHRNIYKYEGKRFISKV